MSTPSLKWVARLAIALLLGAAVSCKKKSSDDDGASALWPTVYFGFTTPDTDPDSMNTLIVSQDDIDVIESQTGQAQSASAGFLYGTVVNSVGSSLAGVQVSTLNDAGVSAGSAIYKNESGVFDTSLTQTSSKGTFVIFNMTPGRVNVRCTSGASGNAYIPITASEVALLTLRAVTTYQVISWSGVTRRLVNVPSTAEPGVLVTGFATGLPFPFVSDGTTGAFNAGNVPANNTYLLKLSGAGLTDTYNLFTAGTTALATPAGDLFVVATTDLVSVNFTPASVTLDGTKGVIRGLLTPASDGYTINCTNLSGTAVGTVRYGAAADGAPSDALATTSTSGIFYIYNAPAGTVYVTAAKTGYGGSAYVEAFAGSVTLVNGQLGPAANINDTISLGGYLLTLQSLAVASGTVQLLGNGGSDTTDSQGIYSFSSVPSHHALRIRATR